MATKNIFIAAFIASSFFTKVSAMGIADMDYVISLQGHANSLIKEKNFSDLVVVMEENLIPSSKKLIDYLELEKVKLGSPEPILEALSRLTEKNEGNIWNLLMAYLQTNDFSKIDAWQDRIKTYSPSLIQKFYRISGVSALLSGNPEKVIEIQNELIKEYTHENFFISCLLGSSISLDIPDFEGTIKHINREVKSLTKAKQDKFRQEIEPLAYLIYRFSPILKFRVDSIEGKPAELSFILASFMNDDLSERENWIRELKMTAKTMENTCLLQALYKWMGEDEKARKFTPRINEFRRQNPEKVRDFLAQIEKATKEQIEPFLKGPKDQEPQLTNEEEVIKLFGSEIDDHHLRKTHQKIKKNKSKPRSKKKTIASVQPTSSDLTINEPSEVEVIEVNPHNEEKLVASETVPLETLGKEKSETEEAKKEIKPYLEESNFDDATSFRLVREVEETPSQILERANGYLEAKDYQNAAPLFESLGNFNIAGRCYYMAENYSQAALMFEEDNNPQRAAMCHFNAGNMEKFRPYLATMVTAHQQSASPIDFLTVAALCEVAGDVYNATKFSKLSEDALRSKSQSRQDEIRAEFRETKTKFIHRFHPQFPLRQPRMRGVNEGG